MQGKRKPRPDPAQTPWRHQRPRSRLGAVEAIGVEAPRTPREGAEEEDEEELWGAWVFNPSNLDVRGASVSPVKKRNGLLSPIAAPPRLGLGLGLGLAQVASAATGGESSCAAACGDRSKPGSDKRPGTTMGYKELRQQREKERLPHPCRARALCPRFPSPYASQHGHLTLTLTLIGRFPPWSTKRAS